MHVDSEPYFIRLWAATTKNRRGSDHPIDAEVAEGIQSLRQSNSRPHDRVFRFRTPRGSTVRRDFAEAGIARVDENGRIVDFHAPRMTFNMLLEQAGVPERRRQELKRHRSSHLTNQVYVDPSCLGLGEAVRKLPRFDDTQIDTQDLVSEGLSASCVVTKRQTGEDHETPQNKANRRVLTPVVATCRNTPKTGEGGILIPSPRLVIDEPSSPQELGEARL